MKNTPFYLHDKLMPVYRFFIFFALILSVTTIFYSIYTIFSGLLNNDSSSLTAFIEGLIVLLKGAFITAVISFISFYSIWKKHQLKGSTQENFSPKTFLSLAS